ncbi:hypothetical protein [uncultured Sunxiuqinia sp.]|uniref:hypothetical protein n=1 Tax=uncultured Sunxiuqinia sp. TaxID=1573825 RepID=UPI0030D93F23|tara:strand:+ start:9973 stop:10173 length:201 start_codon:yes stop_codon:yes gene_type:complete
MKERKQKNPFQGTSPNESRTEYEGYVGGQTYIGIAENNLTDTYPFKEDYHNRRIKRLYLFGFWRKK